MIGLRVILKAVAVIFLIITFLVGTTTYKESKREVDKKRYGFLAVGSVISFIAAII